MAQAIPLVRAVALLPSVRWMAAHDLPRNRMLERNGLGPVLFGSPFRPIPLLRAGALLRDIAGEIGPDAPCRIVADTADRDLVQVGRVALGTRTPAEALTRISFALPYFCSHELLSLEPRAGGLVVRHAYGARFDAETLHLMSQYALAVLDRICAMSGASAPRLLDATLPAHPAFGVSHLASWFGEGRVSGAAAGALTATLPRAVAERRFPGHARDRSAEMARSGLQPLRNGGDFAASVHTLLAAMMAEEEAVSLGDLAEAAGISVRTAQRWLKEEGTSFKAILDDLRREQATRLVSAGNEPISAVAGRLGYARQSSLHRSMLRWTGQSPTAFRKQGT